MLGPTFLTVFGTLHLSISKRKIHSLLHQKSFLKTLKSFWFNIFSIELENLLIWGYKISSKTLGLLNLITNHFVFLFFKIMESSFEEKVFIFLSKNISF